MCKTIPFKKLKILIWTAYLTSLLNIFHFVNKYSQQMFANMFQHNFFSRQRRAISLWIHRMKLKYVCWMKWHIFKLLTIWNEDLFWDTFFKLFICWHNTWNNFHFYEFLQIDEYYRFIDIMMFVLPMSTCVCSWKMKSAFRYLSNKSLIWSEAKVSAWCYFPYCYNNFFYKSLYDEHPF